MYLNKKTLGIFAFWITIILGFLLPIVTLAAVDILKGDKAIGNILKNTVDYYFKDYTDIGFLFWFVQGLIFLALAFLVKSKMRNKANFESSVIEYSQAISAWALTVILSVIMNIDVLVSESSTAVIAYIFIPFYEVIIILIGYSIGWIIGKIILRYRSVT